MTTIFVPPGKGTGQTKELRSGESEDKEVPERETVVDEKTLYQWAQTSVDKHKRPLSLKEYDELKEALENGEYKGAILFSYEEPAVARIIFENFKKFRPDEKLPNIVIDKMENITRIENTFSQKYKKAVKDFRANLTESASKHEHKYSDSEKLKWKKLGVAFSSFEVSKEKKEQMSKQKLQHPFLALGVLKR